jgi:hypothetical protein
MGGNAIKLKTVRLYAARQKEAATHNTGSSKTLIRSRKHLSLPHQWEFRMPPLLRACEIPGNRGGRISVKVWSSKCRRLVGSLHDGMSHSLSRI